MPRLTKIYTRTGDDGTTALGTKARVAKDSSRVRAFGEIDELNAALGLARALGVAERLWEPLDEIQNQLFHLGAELAFPPEEDTEFRVPQVAASHIEGLEALIDRLNEDLDPLENFILPGGSAGGAALHLARTVCRRAERELVTLASHEPVGDAALPYLNRLSDALFVMARYENQVKSSPETLWDSHA